MNPTLLAFGAAAGPPLKRRTYLLPSAASEPVFMPEAAQIVLPAAGSAAEFAQRMSVAIVI